MNLSSTLIMLLEHFGEWNAPEILHNSPLTSLSLIFVRWCVGPGKTSDPRLANSSHHLHSKWGGGLFSVLSLPSARRVSMCQMMYVPPVLHHFHDLQHEKWVQRLGLDSFCKCGKSKRTPPMLTRLIITRSNMSMSLLAFSWHNESFPIVFLFRLIQRPRVEGETNTRD
jgi:hypothetical protein